MTASAGGTDGRVAPFLGRVLDGAGDPVGTCFQLTPGVLATAWHVLDDLGAGTPDMVVQIDPLSGGEPRDAVVVAIDPVHDLAVLTTGVPLAGCVAGVAATDELRPRDEVTVTGVVAVDDVYKYRHLDATGEWAGGTTRDETVSVGRLTASAVLPGMSGAPVLTTATAFGTDGVAVGVVSARYNSADGWLRDSVWVARTENLTPLLAAVTDVRVVHGPLRRRRWTRRLLVAGLIGTVAATVTIVAPGSFFTPEPGSVACPPVAAPAAFTATTYEEAGGANIRVSPNRQATILRNVPANCTIGFSGYCIGERVRDLTSRTPDVRWYQTLDGGFVTSAVLHHTPPADLPPTTCTGGNPPPESISLTVLPDPAKAGSFLVRVRGVHVEVVGVAVRERTTPDNDSESWEQQGELLLDPIEAETGISWTPTPGRSGEVTIAAVACLGGRAPTSVIDMQLIEQDGSTRQITTAVSPEVSQAAAAEACRYP